MVWVAYEKDAKDSGFDIKVMYAGFVALEQFADRMGGGNVLQPESASELKGLLELMEDHQEKALKVMKEWTISLGGRFTAGPLKKADRIVIKARSDYGGNLRKILDGVRASAIFHSLEALDRAVRSLLEEGCLIIVIRLKERFTQPLGSGYRDVLVGRVSKIIKNYQK